MSRLEQTLRKFTARLGSHFADDIARDSAGFKKQVVRNRPSRTQAHDPARLGPASSQPLPLLSVALLSPTPFANWRRSYNSEAVPRPWLVSTDPVRLRGTARRRRGPSGTANPCGPIVLPDAGLRTTKPTPRLIGLGTYAGCSTASTTRLRPGNTDTHHPGLNNFTQAQQDLQQHQNVEV